MKVDMDDNDIILDSLALCWVFGWIYILGWGIW